MPYTLKPNERSKEKCRSEKLLAQRCTRKAVEKSPVWCVTGMCLSDRSNAAAKTPSWNTDFFSTPEKLSGTSRILPTLYFATFNGVYLITDRPNSAGNHQTLHITDMRSQCQSRAGDSSHFPHINSACFTEDLMICEKLSWCGSAVSAVIPEVVPSPPDRLRFAES